MQIAKHWLIFTCLIGNIGVGSQALKEDCQIMQDRNEANKTSNIYIKMQPINPELNKKINAGFSRHAIAMTGYDEKYEPVAFVAKDEKGSFAGAVVVVLFWGALHVKYVYVEEKFRDSGIGTKLMKHALQYGRNNQCAFAFVETMNFQALDFYRKMGFELEFTRPGYKHNTSFHYLRRDL